jgi:hypothetical protein
MKKEKVLPYPCRCGGKLVKAPMHVEYFGIDFGIREGHVCTKCGDEYLTDAVWQEIEDKAKELGIFGIEKKSRYGNPGIPLWLPYPPKSQNTRG